MDIDKSKLNCGQYHFDECPLYKRPNLSLIYCMCKHIMKNHIYYNQHNYVSVFDNNEINRK